MITLRCALGEQYLSLHKPILRPQDNQTAHSNRVQSKQPNEACMTDLLHNKTLMLHWPLNVLLHPPPWPEIILLALENPTKTQK